MPIRQIIGIHWNRASGKTGKQILLVSINEVSNWNPNAPVRAATYCESSSVSREITLCLFTYTEILFTRFFTSVVLYNK